MKRFSKALLAEYIEARMVELEREHGFDPMRGWDQVRESDIRRTIAYGEYDGLRDLADYFEVFK